jgi:hypothetical protein
MVVGRLKKVIPLQTTLLRTLFALNSAWFLGIGVPGLLYSGSILLTIDEHMMFSLLNSIYVAFGANHPARFAVLLVMQSIYLSLWLSIWAIPKLFSSAQFHMDALTIHTISGSIFLMLNLALVPFDHIFPQQQQQKQKVPVHHEEKSESHEG